MMALKVIFFGKNVLSRNMVKGEKALFSFNPFAKIKTHDPDLLA